MRVFLIRVTWVFGDLFIKLLRKCFTNTRWFPGKDLEDCSSGVIDFGIAPLVQQRHWVRMILIFRSCRSLCPVLALQRINYYINLVDSLNCPCGEKRHADIVKIEWRMKTLGSARFFLTYFLKLNFWLSFQRLLLQKSLSSRTVGAENVPHLSLSQNILEFASMGEFCHLAIPFCDLHEDYEVFAGKWCNTWRFGGLCSCLRWSHRNWKDLKSVLYRELPCESNVHNTPWFIKCGCASYRYFGIVLIMNNQTG